MIRAVLDVNVLISAFIGGADGPPRKLIYAWREGRFTLVVSPTLLNELTTKLSGNKSASWEHRSESRHAARCIGAVA